MYDVNIQKLYLYSQ